MTENLQYGEDLPLFVRGMTRHHDHSTSIEAAVKVSKKLSELQKMVLKAFKEKGEMTDEYLEHLLEFSDFASGTVRKRRTELFQKGKLIESGTSLNGNGCNVKVWKIND